MPTLHPELVKLETQYNDLIDAVQNGSLKIEDALRTLDTIRVIDGAGMAWGMNPDGDFIASVPGDPASVAEPSRFQGQVLPTQQSRAPWESGDLFTPPSGPNLHRDGLVQPPAPASPAEGWEAAPAALASAEAVSLAKDDVVKAPRSAKIKLSKARVPRPEKVRSLGGSGRGGASPLTWVAKNKRNVAVAGAAVAAVAVLFLTQGEAPASSSSGIPSSSEVTDADLDAMPVDSAAPQAPAADPAAALPDGDQVQALVTALTSGDRALVAGALAQPGDAKAVALGAAKFSAFTSEHGLTLTAGPVAADGQEGVATLTLVDSSTQEELASAPVKFTKVDQAWKIAAWPVLG